MKKHLLPALLLVAAVALLYAQTGGFSFLRLDDHDYTFRCAFVKDGLSWANAAEAFANPRHAAIWMPVTYLSYMADITFFGPGMGPHHLVNAALHALNALLLYALLLALLPARRVDGAPRPAALWAAFLAALFWALHPQRVEAVAWIAGRKELLCALFTLLGLLCWLRPGRLGAAGAVACCALACMSKPTAMSFPFLAFAVARLAPAAPRRTWRLYLPLLVLAAATGALAVYSQTHPEGRPALALFSASLPWRLLNAAVSTGLYLFQSLVPSGLHLDYRATPGQFPLDGVRGLATLAAAAALCAACAARRPARRRALAALLLFFCAALAPTLGVFGSFGEAARADRFFYLPALALSFALFFALAAPRPASGARRVAPAALLALLVAADLCAAFPLVASYRDDATAFARTLACDPDNGRALAHVAGDACARGRIDRGISLYRRSQALRPRDDTAAQLAYALALRGLSSDFAEIRRLCAKFACDHALDRKGMALEALGTTAMRERKWAEAIACLEASVRAPLRFYSADDARLRLGACYANAGRTAEAIRVFEPLTQSRRVDIAPRARQFLEAVRRHPQTVLFF